ncbi:MAG: hypothetical protein E6Q06_01410 [Candidatus Moraniibacteriota bacterium]|jgi:hypothetical protein|nr:MAG: hypothetical protein E6Q06_01410 [Candidatus Moranbacteria bacterium]
MLNRIANVVTFLTFGLLSAILWLGAVAIHDFNHPVQGDSHIFKREFTRHADYQSYGDAKIGYRIDYTVCGQVGFTEKFDTLKATHRMIQASGPMYGRIELTGGPFWQLQPLSIEEVRHLGINPTEGFYNTYEWGTSTRRVCQVNLGGIWKATGSLFQSLT